MVHSFCNPQWILKVITNGTERSFFLLSVPFIIIVARGNQFLLGTLLLRVHLLSQVNLFRKLIEQ